MPRTQILVVEISGGILNANMFCLYNHWNLTWDHRVMVGLVDLQGATCTGKARLDSCTGILGSVLHCILQLWDERRLQIKDVEAV